MSAKDFIVTPIVIFIVFFIAMKIRPYLTDSKTRKYFIPALSLKVVSALLLGIIYQFYYGYGDTLNYHTKGSRIVYEAFLDNPFVGLKLLFSGGEYEAETFMYASRIAFYKYENAYLIVKIASVLDLFTFSSYGGTAVLFALLGFIGCWMMYQVFYKRFPSLHFSFAMVVLFIPSVCFWSSGILKDTITFSAVGVALFYFDLILFRNNYSVKNLIILILSLYIIFLIKTYILICFIPGLLIWYFWGYLVKIKSSALKLIITPFIVIMVTLLAFWAITLVGEVDQRYSIENIGETARITGVDLAFGTGLGAGSTYVLGQLDGSIESMIRLFPEAINVTLFRPYLWEVNNFLMLIAALESLAILCFTIYAIYKVGFIGFFMFIKDPFILFCFIFSIVFSFAVGVSTFNFGTLMRYKIPIIPFYLSSLILLIDKKSSTTNVNYDIN